MLACVLFLPQKIGAYAYPLGMLISFLLTALLNLQKLCKTVPLSPSLVKKSLLAIALIFPISLIGEFTYAPLSSYFGIGGGIALATLVTGIATFLIYLLCGILPFFSLKKLFLKK